MSLQNPYNLALLTSLALACAPEPPVVPDEADMTPRDAGTSPDAAPDLMPGDTTPDASPDVPANFRRLTTSWRGDGMCLDASVRPQLVACRGDSHRLWALVPVEGSTHARLMTEDLLCLEGSSSLRVTACTDDSGQLWSLGPKNQDGYFHVSNQRQGEGACLDVINDGVGNDQLTMRACDDVSGQQWRFSDAATQSPPPLPGVCAGVDVDALGLVAHPTPSSSPPFDGTVFVSSEILTDQDPTAFQELRYVEVAARTMFDRRLAAFAEFQAHIFDARLGADTHIEVQVNTEFSRAEAEAHALRYLPAIGRLPAFLLRDVDTVWIHGGLEPFGGGNRNLLIHTEQGESYLSQGVLEEVFVHEGTHTSMDATYAEDPRWRCAQALDQGSVSPYAASHPIREDLAETLLLYLAMRHRPGALTPQQLDLLRATIPNRLAVLESLRLTMDLIP